MEKWDNRKTDALIKAVLSLKNPSEARRFLRDLLTEKELLEMGNRWQAARMLGQKITYEKIQKETGLSARTVARISAWLQKGKGGYRLMLDRINHHANRQLSKSG